MLEQSFTADDVIESLTTQQLKERLDGREVPSDEYKDLLPAALQTMS